MIEWHWKFFAALTVDELYEMLAARSAVFVMEQQCLYTDLDGLDRQAWHLYGVDADLAHTPLAACARILVPEAPIRLHAQARLQRFYEAYGFDAASEIHLEDNIEHLWMQRS